MTEPQVWLDGHWLDAGAASWPAADRGALLGDGVFETLRWREGQVERLDRHMARLETACTALGLVCPIDQDQLAELAQEICERNTLADAALRLTVTAGIGPRGLDRDPRGKPSVLLSAAARTAPPSSIALKTSQIRRSPTSLAAAHKTLGYTDNLAARREARDAGAGMALLMDTGGYLSGADCANLFWMRSGTLFTPGLECAVLPGTARAAILDAVPVETGAFGREALTGAECVFVTNALMGAVPVSALDGKAVATGSGIPGSIWEVLD
ncbi:aminotransferase class IV [Maricaulis parjimensis]|uniref:aminotransferase class IV n=1 Tax=Maricaulis parjimensis TaxID=144023 RepID=UPI00193A359A|nr:aminotransferase class IV [Maricaulis parjimensis]